jgi:hypothetical protein
MATRLWAGWLWNLGSIPDVLFSSATRLDLKSTQQLLQWVLEYYSGRNASHSYPSTADVKNASSNTSTTSHVFMAWWLLRTLPLYQFTYGLLRDAFSSSNYNVCVCVCVCVYIYKIKEVKLSKCLINYALCYEDILEWMYSSTILDLGTKWRWVVSFTSRPHYSRRKIPQHPLDRMVGGPQVRSGRCGEQKYLALPAIKPGPSST